MKAYRYEFSRVIRQLSGEDIEIIARAEYDTRFYSNPTSHTELTDELIARLRVAGIVKFSITLPEALPSADGQALADSPDAQTAAYQTDLTKACDKRYGEGAHSVKLVDGVACCLSCGQPIGNHLPTKEATT